MTRPFRAAAIKFAAGVSSALVIAGFAATSAQAAPAAPAAKTPAASCKTFTTTSADSLFGLRKGTKIKEKQTRSGTGANTTWVCKATSGKSQLVVTTSDYSGGFGGPYKCYKRPKLGPDGAVCVGTLKKYPGTFALFSRHGVFFADDFSKTLPQQGARLYTFALAQYKAFKG
jgi:hypothetical protein